jgi:hypothetical protein
MRKNELKCYLTDDELKQVTTQASRELIDPAMWLRRVGVAVAERWSCFLRQAVKVDSAMKRVIHHEDAETVFG